MRNRELITRKLETVEGHLTSLHGLVGRGDVEQYFAFIEKTKELIEEIKSMIDREDLSPNEINRY